MKRILTFTFLLLATSIFSQNTNTYILQTTRNIDENRLKSTLNLRSNDKLKEIFGALNLFSIETSNSSPIDIERLWGKDIVKFISKDQKLTYRVVPNDEYFNKQYGLLQIKANEVWEYTKGGITGTGDSIVIAVLDWGLDIFHKDLRKNIWRNKGEIPNDNIDNDDNGYTDDYLGVDLNSKNDKHNVHNHGTSVAGIIGAMGNNTYGMAGINWNIKILPITSVKNVSDVIEAYNYVYKERKKFNDTNGEKGSLIVSTNLSAGIPNAIPSDKPEYMKWCEIYDLLGSVGILSVTSVDNSSINVEEAGDMPTRCTSDYLITVTSTDENDKFDKSRGYGTISVDIAAPGRNIFTTSVNDNFNDKFTGNSAAAPHVAGAIGLLYTIPCTGFTKRILANPKQLSDTIKEYILNYSDKHSDLTSKTVCGGRLNIYNTYIKLSNLCEDLTTGKFDLISITPNPAKSHFKVEYSTDNFEYHTAILYDSEGRKVYEKKFKPSIFGKKILNIDFEPKNTGVYYLTLTTKERTLSKAVLVY